MDRCLPIGERIAVYRRQHGLSQARLANLVGRSENLEMDPGSAWDGLDVHDPGPEEVFVVAGVFNDGIRDYPAGSFIHAPAGSTHVPQTTTGCTLFVFSPEG